MAGKYFLIFFILISLIACKDASKNSKDLGQALTKNDVQFKFDEPLKLNLEASVLVEPWKEYRNFIELFNRYKSTTPSIALSNAKELNTLAVQLKDSIRISTLKIPAFQARLNVLQNETMRLLDMASISNLKNDDINNQILKILDALNATNAKLNNLVSLQALESDLIYENIDSVNVVKHVTPNTKVVLPINAPHGVKVKQN